MRNNASPRDYLLDKSPTASQGSLEKDMRRVLFSTAPVRRMLRPLGQPVVTLAPASRMRRDGRSTHPFSFALTPLPFRGGDGGGANSPYRLICLKKPGVFSSRSSRYVKNPCMSVSVSCLT